MSGVGAIAADSPKTAAKRWLVARFLVRLMVLAVLFGMLKFTLLVQYCLERCRPLNTIHDRKYARSWVPLSSLNLEIQRVARHARLGDRPGYLEPLLEHVFVDEDTRVELGIQGLQWKGLSCDTSTAEFICMFSGCQFKRELRELLKDAVISEERYGELLLEATRLSEGKVYWNCLSCGRTCH